MKKKKKSAVKLDLGCGPNKKEGFIGVDSIKFDKVDIVADLTKTWPWADNSVDEIHMSHTIEHFTQQERVHVMNEMYRVLKHVEYENGLYTTGFATIIAPYIFADRAYGDPTHKWPAIGDWFYLYLNKEWRMPNAPHTDIEHNKDGYSCDFERVVATYNPHPLIVNRNVEYQQNALLFWKEAAQDSIAVLVKKKKK